MLKEEIMVEKQSRRDEEDSPITERTVKINRVSKLSKVEGISALVPLWLLEMGKVKLA